MARQLIYSTVEEGIDGGRGCLCYAAASNGALNNRLILQNLLPINSYQQLYPFSSTSPDLNPINYSHYRIPGGASEYSILSRICAAKMYGGRSNFFAHHLIVENQEQFPSGPAYPLNHFPFKTHWDHQQNLSLGNLPSTPPSQGIATSWKSLQFDPGWAGWLAEKFLAGQYVHILFPKQIRPLPLIQDAISQLPEHQRWKATFSTYYTLGGNGPKCFWRFIPLEASQYAAPHFGKTADGLVLNLGSALGLAPTSDLVRQARGEALEPIATPVFPINSRGFKPAPTPSELPTFNNPQRPGERMEPLVDIPQPPMPISTPLVDSSSLWLALKVFVCLLALFLPLGTTILFTFIHQRSVATKTLEERKANLEILKTNGEKLAAEVNKLQQDLDGKEKELIQKSTDYNNLIKEFDDLAKWLGENKISEIKELQEAKDLLTKKKDKYLIKIPASKLKPIMVDTEKIHDLAGDIKKPEDVLQSKGKIITNTGKIMAFINQEAKVALSKPLDQFLNTRRWIDEDKNNSSYTPQDKEFIKAFQKWVDTASSKEPNNIKPTHILHSMVATNLLMLQIRDKKNLFAFAEFQPIGKEYLSFLTKEKTASFTEKNLETYLTANPSNPKPVSTMPPKAEGSDGYKKYFKDLDGAFTSSPQLVVKMQLQSIDTKYQQEFLDSFQKYLTDSKFDKKTDLNHIGKAHQLLEFTRLNLQKLLELEKPHDSK